MIRTSTLLVYALPAAALSAPVFFVQFYLLNFATDVLLLPAALVGVVFAVSRVWDAISDPIVGFFSDRTHSALGRRRPWMLVGALATGLCFALLWASPRDLGDRALLLWLGACLVAFLSAATAWGIPHQAFGAQLTTRSQVRTRIYGTRQFASLIGVAVSFSGMQWVINAEDARSAAAQLASLGGLAVALLLLLPPLCLREAPAPLVASAPKTAPWRSFARILVGRGSRSLLGAWLCASIGMATQGAIAPYMAIYLLERPDLLGLFPIFYIVPLVLSIPGWVKLADHFGRERVWRTSLLLGSASYAALFFIQAGNLVLCAALVALTGLATGAGGSIGPSLLASIADRAIEQSQELSHGSFFSAWEFAEKSAAAVVVVIIASALSLSGFEPNVTQARPAELAIRTCLSLLPASSFALAALLVWQLPVSEPGSQLPVSRESRTRPAGFRP